MRIFQSKQVIKLRNTLLLLQKKRMATEFARSQTIALSCVGAMLEHYQKFTPKAPNIAKLKTASSLLSTWNDLPLEFIEAISKETLFSCVAAAGGHFEHNIQFKYRDGS